MQFSFVSLERFARPGRTRKPQNLAYPADKLRLKIEILGSIFILLLKQQNRICGGKKQQVKITLFAQVR